MTQLFGSHQTGESCKNNKPHHASSSPCLQLSAPLTGFEWNLSFGLLRLETLVHTPPGKERTVV